MGRTQIIKCIVLSVYALCSVTFGASVDETLAADPNFPLGDPRRCYNSQNKDMLRFEVLPGGGWDNLCNKDTGMVMSLNYSMCRTTDDGRYLIPDGMYTIPIKSSKVETYAELFEHWNNYTSTLSRSVNVHAGLLLHSGSISGSFSSEYEHVKSRQYFDKSVTTRIQARYVRYTARLQPDTAVNDAFRNRLRKIAAHLTLNRTDLAKYESQLLVRDFGTHVITSIDVGAALVEEDQLKAEFVRNKDFEKNSVLAAASASFFGIFSFGGSYSQTTTKTMIDQYFKSRTSSHVETFGGPIFRPQNFTANSWSDLVAKDMVALDRSGDPIFYAISDVTLPDVPLDIVFTVYENVRAAVYAYYQHNTYRGCTKRDSPNFNFQANIDDGTCKPPNTNFTFGGVYQKCTSQGYKNLCTTKEQKNPMTGAFSCPSGYESVLIQDGTLASSEVRRECHSCWLFFHCCDNNRYTATAQYSAYWCAATGTVPANHGYLFGGVYTKTVKNPLTDSASCPNEFYPLHILDDVVVCVSDDYELGAEYSLPFAGFFSCKSGNPLALGKSTLKSSGETSSLQSFMRQSPSSYPHECPKGYSQHLAVIDHSCEINYCVKFGALSAQGLPKVQKPPFMNAPKDGYSELEASSSFVFSDDGSMWTSMKDASKVIPNYLQHHGLPDPLTTESSSSRTGNKKSTPDSNGSGGSLSGGGIAAISVVATLVCVVVATVIVVSIRKRRNRLYRETDGWDQRGNQQRPGYGTGSGYRQMADAPSSVVSRT